MATTKHNRELKKMAERYQKRGFDVQADIKGFKAPRNIYHNRPDLIARKGKDEVIVEVETRKSFKKDKPQRETFKKYAKKTNKRFRTKIV